ncbi:MAG TPA: hypothetical protein VHS28_00265 [Chloroflexota bacterium]|nr:hypothetical protein [Chloroflexota bacterium]
MADVFRGKLPALGMKVYPWYAFHGVTAVLALFFLLMALGY